MTLASYKRPRRRPRPRPARAPLTVTATEPLWIGFAVEAELTDQIKSYSHTVNALGGYWSMMFTVADDKLAMEDWITDGLGRHIEVYDDALNVIWEGFVNKVIGNDGPLTVTRGPLLDVANEVELVYSMVDSSVTPPTVGERATVGPVVDAASQALYGILPAVLSTGGVDEAVGGEATQIVNVYLEEHKLPKTGQQWSSAARGKVSVTVQCLGYIHWLNYPYEQLGIGTVNTSAKIAAVLAASPNVAWLAFDTANIAANAVQISQNEEEDNIAWGIVKDAVAYGGAAPGYARWVFGIYENMEAHFSAAPTTIEYEALLSDPKLRVTTPGGSEVYPWNVLPARWLMFTDFLPGLTEPANLREDPRAMFIESVTFTAPDKIRFQGGDLDTLSQVIAQLGLSGVGS